MCGEHDVEAGQFKGYVGSSPHVRGALDSAGDFLGCVGIIPACAGSTPFWSLWETSCRDHPRMCGEHRAIHDHLSVNEGSSPHVRGAHLQQHRTVVDRGIIPACAGSTCPLSDCIAPQGDHPRMCGEHARFDAFGTLSAGSSPHVRGAHELPVILPEALGIIPACAGSTSESNPISCHRRDHPRMCGEHYKHRGSITPNPGSSPHVRGARHVSGR